MKLIFVLPTLILASCASLPISSFGIKATGIDASYSAKGGLVIGVDPTALVDNASGK